MGDMEGKLKMFKLREIGYEVLLLAIIFKTTVWYSVLMAKIQL